MTVGFLITILFRCCKASGGFYLAKQYKIDNFPTVLILNPKGNLIARTGYREGGPKNYCKQLADLVKSYQSRPRLRQQPPKVKGLDPVKLGGQLSRNS